MPPGAADRRVHEILVFVSNDALTWAVARRSIDQTDGRRAVEHRLDPLAKCRCFGPHRLVQRSKFIIVEIIGLIEFTRMAICRFDAEEPARAGADQIPVVRKGAEIERKKP